MKNNKIVKWIIALVVALVLMLGIYKIASPKPTQGNKEITIEVINPDGESTKYNLQTNAETLKEAMDELAASTDFSFSGSDSEYGFFLTTVNDIEANYDTDAAYWAIFVNDEYGNYGVDAQPVTNGDTYTFTNSKG